MSATTAQSEASHSLSALDSHQGPAPKRIVTGYGFWIFLLSDFIIFASLFATWGVLVHSPRAGRPRMSCSTSRPSAIETAALLLSSYACGLAGIAAERKQLAAFQIGMLVTAALGALFLGLEVNEFWELDREGRRAAAQRVSCPRSSRWSAATGCMSALGLLWLFTMMAQVFAKGFRADIQRRLLCFSLFWHALDIIWVGIFTAVYLYGVYL